MKAALRTTVENISLASRTIERTLLQIHEDPNVERLYHQWLLAHGLQLDDESRVTVARQAVYYSILNQILGILPAGILAEHYQLTELVNAAGPNNNQLITETAHQVLNIQPKADELGQIYEALVPAEERRRLGHFQTPAPIVELMVHWAVRSAGDYILDPGVGAGVFLAAAHERLRLLGATPDQVFAHLYGVDINPIAVAMTLLGLRLISENSQPDYTPNAHIELADFVTGPLSINSRSTFDAIICNPPYSRHHELVNGYKAEVGQAAETVLGRPLSRLASLYIHFFTRALALLADGGRLAFITPREYLEAGYAQPLRRYILERYRIHTIVLFGEGSLVFPGVLTSACISFIERSSPINNIVRLIEANPTTSVNDLLVAVNGETISNVRVVKIPQTELRAEEKWTKYLHRHTQLIPTNISVTDLGQLLAIKRGIATGCNEFFCLTEEDITYWGIPSEFLQPVVPGARDLTSCVLTEKHFASLGKAGRPIWLFYWPSDRRVDDVPEAVQQYLTRGEQQGISERYICRNRKPWYVGERRTPPDVIFTLFNRGNPRFVLNEARVLPLNVLHGLSTTLSFTHQPQHLKALLAWLNSNSGQEGLRQVGRFYGGMLKAEPRELSQMRVPDVRRLDNLAITHLAMLFDRLCLAQQQNDDITTARQEIDDAFRNLTR